MKLLGIISVGFVVTDTGRKMVGTKRQNISYSVDFKKANDSVRREVLYVYNILIAFLVPVKQVRLIRMCLNKTHSKVSVGKYLSHHFPIQNVLE
jgi:hypothetical protein